MPRSQALKEAQQRYRETHRDTISAINKKSRETHYDEFLKYKLQWTHWRKYLDNTTWKIERKLYLECLLKDDV